LLIYILFYSSSIVCYGIGVKLKHNIKHFFLLSSFLAVWLFSGLRGTVGQDTKNYTAHFDDINTFGDMLAYFGKVEPFFAVLVVVTRLLFDSAQALFLLVSFLQAALLFFVSSRLYHGILFFSIYLLTFYADFHMNVLRAGLAGLFFVSALVTYNDRRTSWLFFFLAVMSHISILAFFPVYALRLGLSFKLVAKIVFGGGLVFLFYYNLYSDVIYYKFFVYFGDGISYGEIPQSFLFLTFVGVVVWGLSKNLKIDLVVAFLIFSIFWVGATQIQIFYRLYSLGALIFFGLALEKKAAGGFRVRPLLLYSIGLGLFFSLLNYTGMENESDKWQSLDRGDIDYTYIPYSTFLDY